MSKRHAIGGKTGDVKVELFSDGVTWSHTFYDVIHEDETPYLKQYMVSAELLERYRSAQAAFKKVEREILDATLHKEEKE